jgi:hypothetical protein
VNPLLTPDSQHPPTRFRGGVAAYRTSRLSSIRRCLRGVFCCILYIWNIPFNARHVRSIESLPRDCQRHLARPDVETPLLYVLPDPVDGGKVSDVGDTRRLDA